MHLAVLSQLRGLRAAMRFSRAGRNWADSTSFLNEESGLEGRFCAIPGGCAVSPRPIKVQMKCFSETVLETVLET